MDNKGLTSGKSPFGRKAEPQCSCLLRYALPRNFLTRTLQNYSHRHPSTHYTCARLNSCVSFHEETGDGTGFRRPNRGVGAVPGVFHAPRDVWVLVEPPMYNHTHLGSKVGVGWALERSCSMHECDRIHIDHHHCLVPSVWSKHPTEPGWN